MPRMSVILLTWTYNDGYLVIAPYGLPFTAKLASMRAACCNLLFAEGELGNLSIRLFRCLPSKVPDAKAAQTPYYLPHTAKMQTFLGFSTLQNHSNQGTAPEVVSSSQGLFCTSPFRASCLAMRNGAVIVAGMFQTHRLPVCTAWLV